MSKQTKPAAQEQPQAPAPEETIDTSFTEIPEDTNNNNEEETSMNVNFNQEAMAAMAENGVSKETFIQAFSEGLSEGYFNKDDLYEVRRRADYLIADKRKIAAAEQKAKREAERAAKNGDKGGLTTGQTIWIAVGIVATVVVVGGVIWWIVSRHKDDNTAAACDSEEGASALLERFDALVTV